MCGLIYSMITPGSIKNRSMLISITGNKEKINSNADPIHSGTLFLIIEFSGICGELRLIAGIMSDTYSKNAILVGGVFD